MDAEELVLASFPKAEAREEAPVYQHGMSSAVMPGYWAIHPNTDLDSEELGHGRTEEQAWNNAASKVGRLAAGKSGICQAKDDAHSRTTRAISTNTSSSVVRDRLRVLKPWSAVFSG
jgi:hypothetical protein